MSRLVMRPGVRPGKEPRDLAGPGGSGTTPRRMRFRTPDRIRAAAVPALTMTVILAVACVAPRREERPAAPAPAPPAPVPSAGLPGESLGLAPGDLSESPAPPVYSEIEAMPGEGPAVAPPYEGAPPVIPHSVADFLPITREENGCVMCHQVEEKIEGEPTPIPPSHYTDMRNAPGEVTGEITGARWVCTSCHAPQTGAQPLVENRFTSR